MDGTLRKLQHLLQLSATEERRKTIQKLKKNQLVPTGQSAIKLTDLIQQIETVAPEVIYVQKTLFKQSNYPISSNLSHFCTCLTRSSALGVCEKLSTSQLNSNATISCARSVPFNICISLPCMTVPSASSYISSSYIN